MACGCNTIALTAFIHRYVQVVAKNLKVNWSLLSVSPVDGIPKFATKCSMKIMAFLVTVGHAVGIALISLE